MPTNASFQDTEFPPQFFSTGIRNWIPILIFTIAMGLLFLVIFGSLGLTSGLFFLLKKSRISLSTDVGGAIFNGIVAVYSIQLAFIVVLVWQQYQATGDRIQQEASKAFNFYRSSRAFPDSSGKRLRHALGDYITSVCKDEWPAMGHDSTSAITRKRYQGIWAAMDSVQPVSESEKIWYSSMVETLNQLGEARSLRVSDSGESVPKLMWCILVLGGVIVISFASLFEGKNNKTHLLKVLLFSLLLSLNGLLIYLLDHPYKGLLKIKPSAYEKILEERTARTAQPVVDTSKRHL